MRPFEQVRGVKSMVMERHILYMVIRICDYICGHMAICVHGYLKMSVFYVYTHTYAYTHVHTCIYTETYAYIYACFAKQAMCEYTYIQVYYMFVVRFG